MKKYYFFFIFKYNFRKPAFNNFLKLKKIKNYRIINLSGPLKYYLLSKVLIKLVQLYPKKFDNIILISCDGRPFIKKNAVNIWFGGTSLRVPRKFNVYKNNLSMIRNFIIKEKNFISFPPVNIQKINFKKNFKIIYIGALRDKISKISLKIWKQHKKKIFKNFSIIDDKRFWKKISFRKSDQIHNSYLDIKNLIRLNVIKEINKKFEDQSVVVGNDWKKHIKNSIPSNYDVNYIRDFYNGNICLDFGSKWGDNALYPRSIEIIEAGGLLLQSKQADSSSAFGKAKKISTFNSMDDLIKKITHYKKNFNSLIFDYKKLSNFFLNSKLSYKTLTKIKQISKL